MEGSSFFQRLRDGLAKTRQGWVGRLEGLFQSHQWNEESLAAMEEILLSADVGMKATQRLIDAVRRQSPKAAELSTKNLSSCLRQEIIGMLKEPERKPAHAPLSESPWVVLFLGVNGVGKTTTIRNAAG